MSTGEKLAQRAQEPTEQNLLYPQVGRLDLQSTHGAHTTLPLDAHSAARVLERRAGRVGDFVMIVNEQIANECRETRQRV